MLQAAFFGFGQPDRVIIAAPESVVDPQKQNLPQCLMIIGSGAVQDAADPTASQASANYLLSLADPDAVLIYGHEPAQWPMLPKAPQPW